MLELDWQTGKQSRIQRRKSRTSLSYVAVTLRLYCKQEVKDTYAVSQFFGFVITSKKCNILVFNWNDNLLTNIFSIPYALYIFVFLNALFVTFTSYLNWHKAARHHPRMRIIDKSVCHSYTEVTLRRCSRE